MFQPPEPWAKRCADHRPSGPAGLVDYLLHQGWLGLPVLLVLLLFRGGALPAGVYLAQVLALLAALALADHYRRRGAPPPATAELWIILLGGGFYLFCGSRVLRLTFETLGEAAMVAVLFALALSMGRRAWRRILTAAAVIGAAVAIGGLAAAAVAWGSGREAALARGLIGYRNHFAAVLNALVFPALWLFSRAQAQRRRRAWLFAVLAGLMVAGLFSSLSRAGLIAFLAGLLLLLWRRSERRLGPAFAVLAGAAVLLLSLGAGPLWQRLGYTAAASGLTYRLQLLRSCAAMWRDHPLFGTGPGTFAAMLPSYSTVDTTTFIARQAHNDYAQGLAEGGLLGLILAVALLVWFGMKQSTVAEGSKEKRAMFRQAVLPALLALAIQAAFDFPLHLPFIAAWVGLGLGLGCSTLSLPQVHSVWRYRSAGAAALLIALCLGLSLLGAGDRGSTWLNLPRLETLSRRSQEVLNQGDAAGALALARTGQRACPVCAEFFSLEGAALARLKRYPEAAAAYAQAIPRDRSNVNRRLAYLRALVACGAADEQLRREVAVTLAGGVRYVPATLEALQKSGLDMARVLPLFPAEPAVQGELGVWLYRRGRYAEAAPLLREAMRAGSPAALQRPLAESLLRSGDAAAALLLIQEMLPAAGPAERGPLYLWLAEAYGLVGEHRQQGAVLEQGCRQTPEQRDLCRRYLEQLLDAGKNEEARKFLWQMREQTGNSFFDFLLSKYYKKTGEGAKALAMIRTALAVEDNPDYRLQLAELLADSQMHRAAATEYQGVYLRQPQWSWPGLAAAREWQKAGQPDQALALLRRILERYPGEGEARAMLRNLEGENNQR